MGAKSLKTFLLETLSTTISVDKILFPMVIYIYSL